MTSNEIIPRSYSVEEITDISEKVFRERLEDSSGGGKGSVERVLAKDNDGGVKLRNRARAYNALTRAYLKVLGLSS